MPRPRVVMRLSFISDIDDIINHAVVSVYISTHRVGQADLGHSKWNKFSFFNENVLIGKADIKLTFPGYMWWLKVTIKKILA